MKIILFFYNFLFKKIIPKNNKDSIKQFVYKVYYFLMDIIYSKRIKVDYDSELNNFGDVLNYYLIYKLTGIKIIQIRSQYYKKKSFLFIGSILKRSNKNSIVWGSGFISKNQKCNEKPKQVNCVRGPLTRDLLMEQGIYCPKIFGDPGLLLPLIYRNSSKKKFKVGIIPHYVDKMNPWLKRIKNKSVQVIDIQNKNIESFIDSVCECEIIISSSLHGIITSDTYGIPSLWVEFSNKVTGNGFKFRDYFMSVGKNITSPIKINNHTTIDKLLDHVCYDKIIYNPKQILKSSPLPIKKSILNQIKNY